jgi:hypothetical protein
MTLPFVVPPLAWPLAILAVAAGLWAYTRPTRHVIKQLWWYMVISRVESYRLLLGQHAGSNAVRATRVGRILFWLLMLPLMMFVIVSFLVCIGLLKNPPVPNTSSPHFDSSRFEIVTKGQSIEARPSLRTATP